MKTRLVLLALMVFSITTLGIKVYSHCHDDGLWEDGMLDLIGWRRWETPQNPELVYYNIGLYDIEGLPSLANGDVSYGASQWTFIDHMGDRVKIEFRQGIRMARDIPALDGINYIDWGLIGYDPAELIQPAFTYNWPNPNNGYETIECDTVFNYYLSWVSHNSNSSAGHCIRNVATHEFGHWIYLKDVDYWQTPAYSEYTMCNTPQLNPHGTHKRESLECEDKWGAWYTYNQWRPGTAPQVMPLPSIETVSLDADITENRIFQAYPSPANPETWLPYELKSDTNLTLEISDSRGLLIRKIKLGNKPMGRYIEKDKAAYWDGKNENGETVASGIYYYSLMSRDFFMTGKVSIVK